MYCRPGALTGRLFQRAASPVWNLSDYWDREAGRVGLCVIQSSPTPPAKQFRPAIGDHLVSVHVRRGAGTGLKNVPDRGLVVFPENIVQPKMVNKPDVSQDNSQHQQSDKVCAHFDLPIWFVSFVVTPSLRVVKSAQSPWHFAEMAQRQKKNAAKLTTTKLQITNMSQFRLSNFSRSGALSPVRSIERRSAVSVAHRVFGNGFVML